MCERRTSARCALRCATGSFWPGRAGGAVSVCSSASLRAACESLMLHDAASLPGTHCANNAALWSMVDISVLDSNDDVNGLPNAV
jgi:hypothetical protein